jgi:DNA-binding MurR/RpiR family transcriptional regulator
VAVLALDIPVVVGATLAELARSYGVRKSTISRLTVEL